MSYKEANINDVKAYLSINFSLLELREVAAEMGVKLPTTLKKEALIDAILEIATGETDPYTKIKAGRRVVGQKNYNMIDSAMREIKQRLGDTAPATVLRENPVVERLPVPPEAFTGAEVREGVLEIHTNGFGFLRAKNYEPGDGDAFVRTEIIKGLGLRKGDWVRGNAYKQRNEGNLAITDNIYINGVQASGYIRRPVFEDMTPIYPDKRLDMETPGGKSDVALRCIDLIAPIGKGQRAIIVSPPKAGKTTILKQIANSIVVNNPDVHLIVLLIDERPEEVTDMQRSVKGEVVYSTFDEMPDHHTRAAELVLARAKRLVEAGRDVVILLDSLTRLARAYNLTIEASGKTLSGGIDPAALHSPKRFFGAARNIENGGSLTIIATALVDTGSRMDEVIYEEFKGTGNMEIHLDRKLSEKRIFPAIDLNKSSTRREDLLLTQKELEGIWSIRKILSVGDSQEATENLIMMMLKTKTNAEFIDNLQGWLKSLR